jgi:hypothetical protein
MSRITASAGRIVTDRPCYMSASCDALSAQRVASASSIDNSSPRLWTRLGNEASVDFKRMEVGSDPG